MLLQSFGFESLDGLLLHAYEVSKMVVDFDATATSHPLKLWYWLWALIYWSSINLLLKNISFLDVYLWLVVW